MNLIEQTNSGKIFSVAYQDSGHYYVTVVSNTGEEFTTIDVSEILEIDADSKPIEGFYEPLITSNFLNDEVVRIVAYHRMNKIQYHFNYNFKEQAVIGEVGSIQLEGSSILNFLLKSFYSSVYGTCLSFYRQGQCVTS